MSRPLAPRSGFTKPSPFDFGPNTYGPRGPFDHGPSPFGDPINSYEPTATASSIERRSRRLYGF
jgi:hypothetical protein